MVTDADLIVQTEQVVDVLLPAGNDTAVLWLKSDSSYISLETTLSSLEPDGLVGDLRAYSIDGESLIHFPYGSDVSTFFLGDNDLHYALELWAAASGEDTLFQFVVNADSPPTDTALQPLAINETQKVSLESGDFPWRIRMKENLGDRVKLELQTSLPLEELILSQMMDRQLQ